MKAIIATILVLSATASSACTLNNWNWKPGNYGKSTVNLTLDISGCTPLQAIQLRLYNGQEFLGAETIYGNATSTFIDVPAPVKSKSLNLKVDIGKPVKFP